MAIQSDSGRTVQWIGRLVTRRLGRAAQIEFQQPITVKFSPWDFPTTGYADAVAVPNSRNIERGDKRTLGRGPQVEFQVSFPLRVPVAVDNQDGDGAASGDSTASGELDALASFDGAASGDSIASGALEAFADFAGVASGDSTASGGLDAFADFSGAASGDSTVDGAIRATYDFPLSATCHLLTQQGARRKQREIIERSRPTPITAFVAVANSDGDGAAEGDSTASGGLDAFGDFAGAASGDSTASGGLDAFADFAGSAIGDSTASGGLNALADFTGSAIGDATASGGLDALANFTGAASGDATASAGLDALADFAGSAEGDATADGTLTALADFAGSAIGDAIAEAEGTAENNQDADGSAIGDSTASGGLDALADCAGSATGDSTCEGFIEDATPVVVTPPVVADAGGTGGQVFRGAWTDRIKKPKRKKRLDDLDEMIAELRSRIEEVPVESTAEDIYQRALRVSQALANQPDPSLRAIDNQIVLLREAINEIDDEEAILLLAA
jgi:hypothetical protein